MELHDDMLEVKADIIHLYNIQAMRELDQMEQEELEYLEYLLEQNMPF